MKRYTLGIIAAGALAISLAAPNSAQARDRHVDISLSFGLPLYVQPAPVVYYRSHYYHAQHHYYPPRGGYPKWHNHHNHGKKHHKRKHHWDNDSYDDYDD